MAELTQDEKLAIGVRVKEVRQSQGLSLEVVHEATKIPMDVLKAIEEGYNIRILTPFYYRGFIKIYCKYLNIDPKEFENLGIGKKTEIGRGAKRDLFSNMDFQDSLSKVNSPKLMRRLVVIVGIVIALFIVGKVFGAIKNYFATRPTQPKVEKIVEKPKPQVKADEKRNEVQKRVEKEREVVQIQEKPNPVETPPPQAPRGEPVVVMDSMGENGAKKGIVLTARARKESWLSVKVDGEVVFQSTLRLGAVETWMGNDKIEITGRNINQLEFELNGKTIGTLGRADRAAKGVIVTKNGLSVTK